MSPQSWKYYILVRPHWAWCIRDRWLTLAASRAIVPVAGKAALTVPTSSPWVTWTAVGERMAGGAKGSWPTFTPLTALTAGETWVALLHEKNTVGNQHLVEPAKFILEPPIMLHFHQHESIAKLIEMWKTWRDLMITPTVKNYLVVWSSYGSGHYPCIHFL